MNRKKVLAACAGLSTAMLLIPQGTALAAYSSTTDSGVGIVDYIENRRRGERENRLSEDQKELQKDAAEMVSELRGPIDSTKPLPVAVEGDDMLYDERTGDVYAKGNVRITEIDARRFTSDEMTGNLKVVYFVNSGTEANELTQGVMNWLRHDFSLRSMI